MSTRSQPPTQGAEPPPWGPLGLGSGSHRSRGLSRCGQPESHTRREAPTPAQVGEAELPAPHLPAVPRARRKCRPRSTAEETSPGGGRGVQGRRPRREPGFLSCDASPRLPHSLAWRPGSRTEEGLLPARVPLSPGELGAQLDEAAEREGWKGQMRPKGCWRWGTGWFRVTAPVADGSPCPLPKAGAGATPRPDHQAADRRGSQHAGCRVMQDAGS